jgi:hypothetical protein
MTYDTLLNMYRRLGRQVGTPAQNDAFNKWADSIQYSVGASNWDEIPEDAFSRGLVDPANPRTTEAPPPDLPQDQLDALIARANAGDADAIAQLQAAGYENTADTESLPLEQGLLQSALPRLLADMDADEGRVLQAQIQSAQAQGDYDLVRQLIARATSGQQLAGEQAMADETAGARRTALQDALAKMYGAQSPVDAARLGEAEGAVTGVNLGLERTLDQLDADRAQQGFVGSSTMDTNAATRATVDARQRGANLVGAAQTANAMDARSIGGFDASQGYSIAEELARQRQSLYNADYGRSLQAALSLPQATNQFLQTQRNIDDQRNAGLNRTLGVLNWWANGSTAPTATYNPVQADGSGNDLAGLGANLTSAALNIGAANNWWQNPSGTYKGIPVTNTYNNPTSTPNWWQTPAAPVATGAGSGGYI